MKGESVRRVIRIPLRFAFERFETFSIAFETTPKRRAPIETGNPRIRKRSGCFAGSPVELFCVFHIGKEANLIEQQEEGILLTDPQAVYLGGGEWEAVRKWLDRVPTSELSKRSGVDTRRMREYRQGVSKPRPERAKAIAEALARMLDGF